MDKYVVDLENILPEEEEAISLGTSQIPEEFWEDDDDDEDCDENISLLPRDLDQNSPSPSVSKVTGFEDVGNQWSYLKSAFRSLSPFTGELIIFMATFTYTIQTTLSKLVERDGGIPSMELVMFRSSVNTITTLFTLIVKVYRENKAAAKAVPAVAVEMEGGGDNSGGGGGDNIGSLPNPLARSRWWELSPFIGQRKHMKLLLMRSVFGATAFSLNYTALPYLEIGDHTAIFFLHPVCTTLLSWPILREPVGMKDLPAVVSGVIGTFLILRPSAVFPESMQGEVGSDDMLVKPRWIGLCMQLGSAVLASLAMMSVRIIGHKESCLVIALWFHGISASAGIFFLASGIQQFVFPSTVTLILMIIVAATSYVGQISLNRAYQLLPAAQAAGYSYFQVVWSFIVSIAFLHEPFNALSFVGSILICGGGFLACFFKLRERRRQSSSQSLENSNTSVQEMETIRDICDTEKEAHNFVVQKKSFANLVVNSASSIGLSRLMGEENSRTKVDSRTGDRSFRLSLGVRDSH